jgi:hypothetical protein
MLKCWSVEGWSSFFLFPVKLFIGGLQVAVTWAIFSIYFECKTFMSAAANTQDIVHFIFFNASMK